MKIYPLQFEKIMIKKEWGTSNIDIYNYHGEDKIGEVWLLSDLVPKSVVKNGELKGKDFTYVMSHFAKNLIGEDKPTFPLCIKYLACDGNLSYQVHPDLKTEVFYSVTDNTKVHGMVDPSAGLTKEMIKEDPSLLKKHSQVKELKTGVMGFLKGGTLHSLMPGSRIFEVSDSFDCTYRLYDDYGRELNLKQGLEALVLESDIKIDKGAMYTGRYSIKEESVNGRKIIEEDEAFKIIIPLEGKLAIETNTDFFDMDLNEVTLVPYDVTGYSIVGFGKYLDIKPNNFI